jgi:phage tail tube protein FII
MPADIFVMEAANLFCGDHDPSASNHLTLTELKLPALENNFSDHNPGGAPIAIEINTHVNRLEATFNLAGWNPLVHTLIGRSTRQHQTFTAYGAVRARRTGRLMEAKAIMQGELGRVNPTAFRHGDVMGHEYSIRAIVHYELYLDSNRLVLWDFYESTWVMGDVDVNADRNRILRILGTPLGAVEG